MVAAGACWGAMSMHADDQLIPQGVGHVIPHPWSWCRWCSWSPPCVNGAACWLAAGARENADRGGGELPDRAPPSCSLAGVRAGSDRGAGCALGGQAWACPWFPAAGAAETSDAVKLSSCLGKETTGRPKPEIGRAHV